MRGKLTPVILSEAKDLSSGEVQILRFAQDDTGKSCHPFASLRAGSERRISTCCDRS